MSSVDLLMGCEPNRIEGPFHVSSCNLGMWSSRRHHALSVLVLDKFLVLIVDTANLQPSRFRRKLSQRFLGEKPRAVIGEVLKQVPHSPFNPTPGPPGASQAGAWQTVVVLEIAWSDVQGLDYRNPLCFGGRVVVEASCVSKKQFSGLLAAYAHYLGKLPAKWDPHQPETRAARIDAFWRTRPGMQTPEDSEESALEDTPYGDVGSRLRKSQRHSDHNESKGKDRTVECTPSYPSKFLPPPTPKSPRSERPIRTRSRCYTEALPDSDQDAFQTPYERVIQRRSNSDELSKTILNWESSNVSESPTAIQWSQSELSNSLPEFTSSSTSHLCSTPSKRISHMNSNLTSCSTPDLQPGGYSSTPAGSRAEQRESLDSCLPSPHRWTKTCKKYGYATVVIHFTDPLLPFALQRILLKDQKLLRHYERGLPSWAVFLPSYGLPYRPWFRWVYDVIFVVTSVVALIFGFYDLYKNIPGAKEALHAFSAPALEWLEMHTSMRLSILATFMLSKFAHLELLVVNLRGVWNRLRSITVVVFRPFSMLTHGVWELGAWVVGASLWPGALFLLSLLRTVVAPFTWAIALLAGLVHDLGDRMVSTFSLVVQIPLLAPFRAIAQACYAVFDSFHEFGDWVWELGVWSVNGPMQLAQSLFRGGAGAASQVSQAAPRAYSPLMMNLFSFANRLWKDFKSILNFIIHVCNIINQHRLSSWNYCHSIWQNKVNALNRRVTIVQEQYNRLRTKAGDDDQVGLNKDVSSAFLTPCSSFTAEGTDAKVESDYVQTKKHID